MTPTFTFGSNQALSTFEYSLDGGPFTGVLGSSLTLPTLNLGFHTIQVHAVNGGVTDDTPAIYTWEIVSGGIAPETVIEEEVMEETIVVPPTVSEDAPKEPHMGEPPSPSQPQPVYPEGAPEGL